MSDDEDETVKMTVNIPKPLHKEAKIQAIIEECTLREVVIDALENYFQR